MIKVTKLNGSQMIVNADLIETLEATPDTVMTLTNDDKWVIRESPDEIVERVVAYRRAIHDQTPRVISNEPDTNN